MAKSVFSQRDPLTPKELKRYEVNKRKAAKFRQDFLKANPKADYIRIFTEARAQGRCRTKFWGPNKETVTAFQKWFEKVGSKYPKVKAEILPGQVKWNHWQLTGISITVG